jgi:hypothetical protein
LVWCQISKKVFNASSMEPLSTFSSEEITEDIHMALKKDPYPTAN